MTTYAMPELRTRPEPASATVYAVASGDLRLAANTTCWPAQQAFEEQVRTAFATHGWAMERAHDVDPVTGHGFIDSQARGIEVFRSVPKDAPVVVVDAVWQYSHHVLAGLRAHRGPILIVANWSGQFPGLVGLLNLTASLTKAKIEHSILWSRDFTDEWALGKLREWIETGTIEHETPHVRDLPALRESDEARLGSALAEQLRDDHAIIGIFDEAAWACTTRSSTTRCSTPPASTRSVSRRARCWPRWTACRPRRPTPRSHGSRRPG